jgi:hypothetical protein
MARNNAGKNEKERQACDDLLQLDNRHRERLVRVTTEERLNGVNRTMEKRRRIKM